VNPFGIRPAFTGPNVKLKFGDEYMVASESGGTGNTVGFTFIRECPGEAIYITEAGALIHPANVQKIQSISPCLFEFVYFARPIRLLNGISSLTSFKGQYGP